MSRCFIYIYIYYANLNNPPACLCIVLYKDVYIRPWLLKIETLTELG